ncbi:MAG: FAD:protein FMN transferase, partial [Actinomycetota bacterium]
GYDRDFAQVARGWRSGGDGDSVAPVIRIRPVPGWRMVVVDRAASTVRIPAGVELDLGATAKALCADRAAAAASAATGAGVLVSLGGDIATAGSVPEGGWVVRVTDNHAGEPDEGDGPGQTISIVSGGLATSSTTVRRWAGPPRGGEARGMLHHIIDPSTGAPAAAGWRTASVVAASCVDANTASTAAIILGPQAPAWLHERGLAARLVADGGEVTRVAGWPEGPEGPDHDPGSGGRSVVAIVSGLDSAGPGKGRAS